MNEVIGIKVWLDAGFWGDAKPESGFYFGGKNENIYCV
jgi:hypothetical protein